MGNSNSESIRAIGLSLSLVVGAAVSAGCQPREPETGGNTDDDAIETSDNQIVNLSVINLIQPADEVERLKQRALSGDNRAAYDLANHYSQAGPREEELRWLTLGANRGDCAAMDRLVDEAERVGDRQGRRRWNDLMRQNICTWGKAYPRSEVPNPDLPLWDDE